MLLLHGDINNNISAAYEGVRAITANPRFEVVNIIVIVKTFSPEAFPQCRFSCEESEWNFIPTNGIRREWGRFLPVYVAWRALSAKIWNSRIKKSSSLFAMEFCHGNSDSIAPGMRCLACGKVVLWWKSNSSCTSLRRLFSTLVSSHMAERDILNWHSCILESKRKRKSYT